MGKKNNVIALRQRLLSKIDELNAELRFYEVRIKHAESVSDLLRYQEQLFRLNGGTPL